MVASSQVTSAPQTIHRRDYTPPPYLINTVDLNFILNEDTTHVHSKLQLKPNYSGTTPPDLFLHGRPDVKLLYVKVNGTQLTADSYELGDKSLTVKNFPAGPVTLEVGTEIKPQKNTSLEGLYKSGGNFCTQCEAEGFRGITFFLDRPDVMSKYTTRVEAAKGPYPVLLSNGNLIDSGDVGEDRHYAVWEDPFLKPCYLFALVAGDLQMKEREFITSSGRKVVLRIFVSEKNLPKVDFALDSLIQAMKWDEDTFGLEYDLDLFNIVAVDDFNMGAMENKSLNIFNSSRILTSPQTATDVDFKRVQGVVGHEYFHNWTGNRVTCRDWFQLTLKEGLTRYRDQEFSADMLSRPVKRIEDVMLLRSGDAATLRPAQFSEDAGPMAHPVRPDSYIKMDNFYTVTVYQKGAEVVRMYKTLLGTEGFRKGMDLYFKRHDGQAVTCDDFLAAMADANGADLSGLATWYEQAGTPQVTVATSYNPSEQTFTIKAKQATPPTAGQPDKKPLLIPLAVGLLGPDGKDLPLRLKGEDKEQGTTAVLRLTESEQEFVFTGVTSDPVPSILRGFSAPVKLTVQGLTDDQLLFLFAHDSEPFNRWEAGQCLALNLMLRLYEAATDSSKGADVPERLSSASGVPDGLVEAYRSILTDSTLDGSFKSLAISLPPSTDLLGAAQPADPVLCHKVHHFIMTQLAARLRPELEQAVKANDSAPGDAFSPDAASVARRSLKNKALEFLATLGDPEITASLLRRFREATNMTDQLAALGALIDTPGPERETALKEFYKQFEHQPLVINKWLAMQAGCQVPGNVSRIRQLESHTSFVVSNPNKCYSLYLGFARSTVNFHAIDGSGYEFLADAVLKADKINHQVAARLAAPFTSFKLFDSERQVMILRALKRIHSTTGLSENVFEIVSKSLESGEN